MMEYTVLITGAGAPGITGTIHSLRENPDNTQFRLVTTDIQENPVGKYLCDAFYRLPAPESATYLEELKKIVETEKVQVILPQTTREIEVLSREKQTVEGWGTKLVLSDESAIHRANDKYLVLKECERNGIPVPEHVLVNDFQDLGPAIRKIGYPEKKVVVKPRLSNGQRGVKIITTEALTVDAYLNQKPSGMETDLESFLAIFGTGVEFPELIVSEYMPGMEYTVDMYRCDGHEVVIPRSRDVIRSGISFQTTVEMERTDIAEYSRKLANSLGLNFCFGFQFKLDDKGIAKILESNPRVQGTMIASTLANFNMIYYSVMSSMGEDRVKNTEVRDRTCFKRTWGGIGIDSKGNETGRI
jgi:carbamoyl-phosphate synthase large subunit